MSYPSKIEKVCTSCLTHFFVVPSSQDRRKFCSLKCKGAVQSELYTGVGHPFYGKSHTQESKIKVSNTKKGTSTWNKGLTGLPKQSQETISKRVEKLTGQKRSEEYKNSRKGENNPRWIKDRSKLQRYNDDAKDRRSYAYTYWRKEVWLRDNFACKIANPDCAGRIEAHHILSWRDYPELRYQVNNGITLCHAHHPRVRAEEKRLSPYFQSLVSVSK